MSMKPDTLKEALATALGAKVLRLDESLDELTLTVRPADYLDAVRTLRDAPALRFEELIDLCGVDYSAWGDGLWEGARFAVVLHLLSIRYNRRLRVRVFAADDDFPVIESITGVWPVANWYEREAFDLFGIVFTGHDDLRRILTDYGFVGYPFRKDFPVSGTVEMRYDTEQKRVIYQPVTIEPREVVPRIIREDNYAGFETGFDADTKQ